jgi:endonuclease YncB( thermonuclease family)
MLSKKPPSGSIECWWRKIASQARPRIPVVLFRRSVNRTMISAGMM